MSVEKSKDRPSDEAFERTVKRLLATPPMPRDAMPKKRLHAESRPVSKAAKAKKK